MKKQIYNLDRREVPDRHNKKTEGGLRKKNIVKTSRAGQPLVTVVTVVYNAKNTIERSIRSVLNQTYKNIEYIIIDGGSTDGTLDIIKKHDNVIDYYKSEPDDGIYNAMNKGISLATGDYICLLNADDYYADDFIDSSVQKALKTNADIVYSRFAHSGNEKNTLAINDAVYIHHLNINHCTFLVTKDAYKVVGPYREDYKIVSDVIWTRRAYQKKLNFVYLDKCMFFFTEGGTSSGNNLDRRALIINEAAKSSREIFCFLTQIEAEELYLSRFNIKFTDVLSNLYKRYAVREALFKSSLREYLKFMLLNEINFNEKEIDETLPGYRKLCNKLNIDYSYFNIKHHAFDVNSIISNINKISKDLAQNNNNPKILLHFVAVFSSPSETFIYDLIQRLEDTETYSNIILCDERILEDVRTYKQCIHISWEKLPASIREMLYEYVFEKIKPDTIITHFAINGWKLHQRLKSLQEYTPTIHMTHGIDVFSIDTIAEYRDFILDYATVDPGTAFTTVSHYLYHQLLNRGVTQNKINLVPNVVHERFFKHRKCSNFYNPKRTLKVLNVGRLVSWKGHSELLDGLNYYVKNVSDDIHLTILFGKSEDELKAIKTKINNLGLINTVSLISFVNFNQQPDYYKNFDLFISSSKYTKGEGKRSETFGMSTLEAIAAGLPVIVTDAGGSPEVVGEENIFAKIVPHEDGIAIGKAMQSLVNEMICFQDNLDYAKQRLSIFNSTRQIEQLGKVIEKVMSPKTKLGIFSSSIEGGAGKAAKRVHKALMINGIESHLILKNNNKVVPIEPNYIFLAPEIGFKWSMMQSEHHQHPENTIFSLNEPNICRTTLQQVTQEMDVINIHWVARFLTAEDIGYLSNLGKPLVITVRDMHPITGGCHFFHGCDRWQADCYGCPQLVGDEDHYPAKILALKKRYWNFKNITFVALSRHSEHIIKQSSLYNANRIEVIANPIDLKAFSPTQKKQARVFFKIKSKNPLLFYVPSYDSRIKGGYEFKSALGYIKKKYPNFRLTLLMAGYATALIKESEFSFPIIHLGEFNDDTLLAKAYSAADATVIPSLEETFSNTAAESVSCGTPIVGFNTGAIPEIAGSGIRGESVQIGDVAALGEAIYQVLTSPEMAGRCRSYAEQSFSFNEQGKKYATLFNELKNARIKDRVINPIEIPVIDSSITESTYRWQQKVLLEEGKKNKNNLEQAVDKFCRTSFVKSLIGKYNAYRKLNEEYFKHK